jgi:hypothetical protein
LQIFSLKIDISQIIIHKTYTPTAFLKLFEADSLAAKTYANRLDSVQALAVLLEIRCRNIVKTPNFEVKINGGVIVNCTTPLPQGVRLSGNLPESNHRRHRPLHPRIKKTFVLVALSAAAFPVWAAHNYSEDWNPIQPITIGTTQLKPGEYQLRAEEGKSELQVIQHNKVVATVPVHWKTLSAKSHDSQVVTDSGKVTEVQFGGRMEAAEIDN